VKRSEINATILLARDFFEAYRFKLPRWAAWSVVNWGYSGEEMQAIRDCQLGWDVTDFGLGNFPTQGMTTFMLRNGVPSSPPVQEASDEQIPETTSEGLNRHYSEKIMLVQLHQTIPLLALKQRTHDLINRGGGDLVIQVYQSTPENELDEKNRVPLQVNGIAYNVKAGGIVRLVPGDGVTLQPGVFHKYWPEKASCIVGNISTTCDETNDYLFFDPNCQRFPEIEPDESPIHLLHYEYPDFS
jgi:D-lyxose ketol-isomerase